MKRVLLALALSLPVAAFAEGAASDPFVKGDAAAGAAKAAVCGACHGAGGNGAINPIWPKLAAQGSKYVYEQLVAFKSGKRENAVMAGQAAALSEQDMADLAAYFAAQPAVPGVASEASVPVAQKLYRAGDAARGLPACAACHGPKGAGNPAAAYPQVAGQNTGYAASSLRAYRAGERGKEGNGQMMTAVAKHLTDAEIDALSSYLSGLQ
ncbi:c-type cytochrome [Nevskia sp.]|uniref:c-type cytochrome n=1 Tax=Nevskia sp. TaxID=1929292 RepID=UPI0025E2BF2A|nr:c-type cytochrome [Nevskia sp.]